MDEEYNPFQSPEAAPTAPSYLVAHSINKRRGAPFASGHVRAIFAIVILGIYALFDIACIGLYVSQYNVLDRLQHGEHIEPAKLMADGQRLDDFEQTKIVLFVAAAIAFPVWVHRAYRNLPSLGNPAPAASPAWAAGSYFVPFVNLVVPYTIMAEIWRYSDPAQLGVIRKTSSGIVGVWWGLFIGRGILFTTARFMVAGISTHSSLADLKQITLWAIIAYVVELAGAILAILVVRTVDKNQQATHDLIAAQPQVESPNQTW